ncbi:serine hydrolase [uncultured Algibacter sp.]|uniref:serine hydrolase domain-containing protein n=1 Tax=uncultured Algibacter sp. TaxID=298659 RepID=UPI002633F909|nr:serine hydrolase domain-containing protein [uncultured Algibacter sp.]
MINSENTISTYLNELSGSGWEEITIQNILDMASGIDCPVDFENMDACFAKSIIAYGIFNFNQQLENPLDYLRTIEFSKKQGTVFEYSDINTMMLTMLVEKVTNERFIKFVERDIWQKIGVENDAIFQDGGYGRAASPLGMNSTLRDLARFGLAFSPSGRTDANPTISDRFLNEIQNNLNKDLKTRSWFSDEERFNSYQWDEVYEDGDFYKHGHGGQGLYVSPSEDLVIAFFGMAGKDVTEHWLPTISRQLATSEIFKN